MSQSDQILRTGVLFKKGSGSGLLGRKNWKPRYFVLTPSKLKYFTFEDGDLRGEVDLTGCDEGMVEVMPMDSMKTGSSASTIWRIAVNAPERRLLVAAGTEMEMNDWVDKLMMAFRINNGGPMHLPQRTSLTQQAPNSLNNGFSNSGNGNGSLSSSMNGGGGGGPGSGNGVTSITDFQNFTIARRMHHGGRQSMNPDFPRQSDEQQQAAEQHRVESQRHADEEHEMAQRQQQHESEQLRLEEMEREQAYQIEQTRRHEEAKQEAAVRLQHQDAERQRQQEEADEARRYHEEALRQEAEEEAQRLALEQQLLAVEREREGERQRIEADKLLEQQRQSHEAMLEQQRRLKREKHERERAEREQQMRDVERQAELEKQKAQLAAQESFACDQSESGEEYDLDEEEEVAPVPRSSLIGEVKREAMMKQQAEHQRRREAALKEEQRRQRDLELEKKMASVHLSAGSQQQPHREVEIPSRVVEIVRRAPPAKKAPEEATTRLSIPEKTESVEF
ncbi:Pleckstrin homology-like domain [Globisporangium polare]